MQSVSDYTNDVEDQPKQGCLHVRPRRNAEMDKAYKTIKVTYMFYDTDSFISWLTLKRLGEKTM